MSFDTFKNKVSSEKITLATIEPAKRLIGFTLHSGSIYKILSFDIAVITSIKHSGVALTEVASVAECTAGKFYNDRTNRILYLQTSTSVDPNSVFLHMNFKLFFASVPVTLPYDLASGFDVYWEPQIANTSSFGVEIDTVNQQNESIEGSGSLTLFNDQVFWPANFDKLFFDNQNCIIYSWNRDLLASEAKLLFKGRVESKSYNSSQIVFKLKDLLSRLRNTVSLSEIKALALRNPPNLAMAKQRMIVGRVFGHRPTNVDAIIDGKYPLTGTIAATTTSTGLVGTGTQFLTQLSPDDRVVLSGVEYTIASVTNDTNAVLTEAYSGVNISGVIIDHLPQQPKRWLNRVWNVAGHVLRQPVTTVQGGSSTSYVFLVSTQDMFDGDFIYFGTIGSGELVQISEVINATAVRLATSLATNPVPGTVVTRPSIQQVKINEVSLVFNRDYSINPTTATLTLSVDAEKNAASTREGLDHGTFTNGSRTVTGTATFFKSFLKPGYVIRPKGTSTFHEILSVDTDESLTLRSAPSGLSPNPKTAAIQYKSLIYDDSKDFLHCEVIGRTIDGLSTGALLRKAPEIVNQLLIDAGFSATEIDSSSFATAAGYVPEEISFVIPKKFNDKTNLSYRDVINSVNKSIFGILFQNDSFKMSYNILQPIIPVSPIVIMESDTLNWSCESTNKNMIKRAIVEYNFKEYDQTVGESNFSTVEKTSDIANHIMQTSIERRFISVLVNQADAQRLCNRWKFLLEFSSNVVKIQTKLQLINAQINDVIDFSHRKFYQRFSGTSKRKFLAIEKVKKNGEGVAIEAVDLANAFNRIALVSNTTAAWVDANEEIRIRNGFISNDSGLINNSEDSFQVNLIW